MANINIDQMSVTAEGLSTDDGRRLARSIGEKLAAASNRLQSTKANSSVSVTVSAGNGIDRMAEQIVEDIIRQLNRST